MWLHCILNIARSKMPRCAGRGLPSTCGLNKHDYCLFKWKVTKNISHSPAVGVVQNCWFSKHWQSIHSVIPLRTHTLGEHMGQIKHCSEYPGLEILFVSITAIDSCATNWAFKGQRTPRNKTSTENQMYVFGSQIAQMWAKSRRSDLRHVPF